MQTLLVSQARSTKLKAGMDVPGGALPSFGDSLSLTTLTEIEP